MSDASMPGRVGALDWPRVEADLEAEGHALLERLLAPQECCSLAALYAEPQRFRSRVVMERHGYGRGEYQYFARPLPAAVAALREALYGPLAAIANRWQSALGSALRFPDTHETFLRRCHAAGQTRPTPLLLRYGPGDYNCLHQDLYGEQVFPLQLVVLLSEPGRDFEGGEFVMTEQRPRRQSRAIVVPLAHAGDAALIPVRDRPAAGPRGPSRVQMRHGVSRLRRGERHVLGIIFHDAA